MIGGLKGTWGFRFKAYESRFLDENMLQHLSMGTHYLERTFDVNIKHRVE